MKYKPACDLESAQSGVVDSIECNCPGYLKLLEMGIIPGKKISLKSKAPFNGPICFCIENEMIMVRKQMAQSINVKVS